MSMVDCDSSWTSGSASCRCRRSHAREVECLDAEHIVAISSSTQRNYSNVLSLDSTHLACSLILAFETFSLDDEESGSVNLDRRK